MTGKCLSRAQLHRLAELIKESSEAAVLKGVQKLSAQSSRRAGRPPERHPGNLAAIYNYVECHRHQKIAGGGRELGITGACAKLKRALDTWTVDCRDTAARLRAMYYEAKKLAEVDATAFAKLMWMAVDIGGDVLPILMVLTPEGMKTPKIDRSGRGGRPKPSTSSEIVH
jgi:hypothetical protein